MSQQINYWGMCKMVTCLDYYFADESHASLSLWAHGPFMKLVQHFKCKNCYILYCTSLQHYSTVLSVACGKLECNDGQGQHQHKQHPWGVSKKYWVYYGVWAQWGHIAPYPSWGIRAKLEYFDQINNSYSIKYKSYFQPLIITCLCKLNMLPLCRRNQAKWL